VSSTLNIFCHWPWVASVHLVTPFSYMLKSTCHFLTINLNLNVTKVCHKCVQ
jgi:hypothetical protein